MRLCEGTSVTNWGRTLGLHHPDRPNMFVESKWLDHVELLIASGGDAPGELVDLLGDFLADVAPGGDRDEYTDPIILQRMVELDRLYLDWLPGFGQRSGDFIGGAQALAANRRILQRPRYVPTSLPASVAHRARVIADLEGKQVVLLDDPDGLSVLLAQNKSVTVIETDARRRQWLRTQAHRAKVQLTIVDSLADTAQFDIAAVSPDDPRLLEVCAHLLQDGTVVTIVHLPWGKAWKSFANGIGLEMIACHREVEYVLLPGGRVFDAAGDLQLHRRQGELREFPPLASPSSYWLDVDAPAHWGLQNPCEQLADTLSHCALWPETNRSLDRVGERDVLWWSSSEALGLVAELWRDRQRLLVTFNPYSPELSFAAMAAVSLCLCDDSTRFRAHHGQWQMQNLSQE